MKKRYFVLLALLALLLASLACNFPAGGVGELRLENLRMALDQDGNNPTTVFSPSDVFYVVGDLSNAPAGTLIDAKWLAAQIEGYEPDELIYEQTINDFAEENFSGTIYFELSNDSDWPVGQYKVDVYLNGSLAGSIPFSVQ
jgi:hypothetical protein